MIWSISPKQPSSSGDGVDLSARLCHDEPLGDRLLAYYFGAQLQAVRRGPWKLILPISEYPGQPASLWYLVAPELFHRQHRLFPQAELYRLDDDIAECRDLAAERPDIVAGLTAAAADFDAAFQADRRAQVWLEPVAIPAAPPPG